MNIEYKEDRDGIPYVQIYEGVDPLDDLFFLKGDRLSLWVRGKNLDASIPNWLAGGIRELVKNKIEQENNRGA